MKSINKMWKKLLPMIMVSMIGLNLSAQRAVQKLYLSNQNGIGPDWFDAYSKGNYEKAFKLMTEQKIRSPKKQFLTNALRYANRKTNINDSVIDTWGKEFYSLYPKSKIKFSNQNIITLPLERNVFVATIGKDSVKVLFDTGGAGISISKKLVERHNLPRDTTITGTSYMPAFKRVSKTSPAIIEEINFGDLELSNLRADYVIDVTDKGEFESNQEYDILMGLDILIGFIHYVRFDWKINQIIFSNEKLEMTNAQPFLFFDSKPITVLQLGNRLLTTVFDTGSPVDILEQEYYQNLYSKKEEKKYGDYAYNLYSVPIKFQNTELQLGIADYMNGFNLKLDGEIIDLIVGTAHKQLTIDLANNKIGIK